MSIVRNGLLTSLIFPTIAIGSMSHVNGLVVLFKGQEPQVRPCSCPSGRLERFVTPRGVHVYIHMEDIVLAPDRVFT